MNNIQVLHRGRKSVEGKKIDFLFVQDEDFRILMLGTPQDFIKEHQEGKTATVLVSYPSLNSVVPAGVSFPVTVLQEIIPDIQTETEG
ncbi:hypothetical protein [Cesiribacter sp. SM1]|uniref:hypothetical protein n=1 Tax=Cesiribacter sp. SM1 TaxID=2861196 RepID=UPI001CD6A41E|nr:hypothetical protein [Cesiribacter sp. SM1]